MTGSAADTLPMPAAYFRLFLRRFGRSPELAAQIVEGTGVSPETALASSPEDEIELEQQLRQVRNLAKLLPSGWGLDVGSGLDAGAHGTLGLAAASAPTLADGLAILERFAYVRAPYFRLSSDIRGDVFTLRVEPQLRLEPPIWIPIVETLLLSIQALVESGLGRRMSEARFDVNYATPEHADRYSDFLHAPIVFDQPDCVVVVPAEWLPLPCPFADPALHQSSLDRLESAERRLKGEEFIVAQVARILEGAGDSGLDLDTVASRLHLSTRTLVRRLGRSGSSFRAIAGDHRRRRAIRLLAEPGLTMAEIADQLGYGDAASFGRACRRWFGVGPRAYRERLPTDLNRRD